MRIAVCDDDQNFCKEMLKYLQGYFKEKKLRQPEYVCFSSGEAMMKAGGIFDMAFLDVEKANKKWDAEHQKEAQA